MRCKKYAIYCHPILILVTWTMTLRSLGNPRGPRSSKLSCGGRNQRKSPAAPGTDLGRSIGRPMARDQMYWAITWAWNHRFQPPVPRYSEHTAAHERKAFRSKRTTSHGLSGPSLSECYHLRNEFYQFWSKGLPKCEKRRTSRCRSSAPSSCRNTWGITVAIPAWDLVTLKFTAIGNDETPAVVQQPAKYVTLIAYICLLSNSGSNCNNGDIRLHSTNDQSATVRVLPLLWKRTPIL